MLSMDVNKKGENDQVNLEVEEGNGKARKIKGQDKSIKEDYEGKYIDTELSNYSHTHNKDI